MRSAKLADFESSQINTNPHNKVILIRAACLALGVGDDHIFQFLRNFRILITIYSVMGRPQRIFSDGHKKVSHQLRHNCHLFDVSEFHFIDCGRPRKNYRIEFNIFYISINLIMTSKTK